MNEFSNHLTSFYKGGGINDLSVFEDGPSDQDLEAKFNLNMAVLEKAGKDLLSKKWQNRS